MQKVIITGADGFVGSYVVQKFLEEGKEVLAIDIHEQPVRLFKHPNLKYVNSDVFNISKLENDIGDSLFDTFIHFAWVGSAGPDRMDYDLQMKNANNVVECVKLAKKIGCNRFVGVGSIMEYEAELATHSQGSKPGKSYIYGIGKQLAHSMAKITAVNENIDFIWPMITNTYGIGELSPRFLNSTLRKIINGDDLDFTSGCQNYDFIYVTDVADAFYCISEKGKPYYEYIIGSGNAKPLREFIIEMRNTCDETINLNFGKLPYTGVNIPLNYFDITSLKQIGFTPKIDFKEGIQMTMKWLKEIEK